MNIFDKFIDLFKRELPKQETEVESLFSRLDVDQFFNGLNNLWNPSELIRKIGGLSRLEKLYKDPEIYAAWDKRQAALMDTNLTFEGGDASKIAFLEKNVKPYERQLKQDFSWSVPYGYGVEQIIYNPDRSGNVIGYQKEEFWRFEPLQDLIHVKILDSSNVNLIGKVMPYGKWVLTTHNGSFSNPMGEAMFERLIQPWIFRCNGWELWMDFAKRFANGFLQAQIEDMDKANEVKASLEKAGKSSVLVNDKSTTITLHQASRDSSLYDLLDTKTVATMQKVILGESRTSGTQDAGAYGMAVHNEVRVEKTMADIKFLEQAFDELIKQLAAVNKWTGDLPKAKIIYDQGLNLDKAARDSQLNAQGVRFTKPYYETHYGLKPEEFDIAEPTPQFGFSAPMQKKKTYLKIEDIKEYIGLSNDCPDCSRPVNLAPNITRKENRQADEKEETVSFLMRSGTPPISNEDLFNAIDQSKNKEELEENLGALFDQRSNDFLELMTDTLYYSAAQGALFGNPKKIKAKDE